MKVLVIEQDHQTIQDISFCLQVRYPDVSVISVDDGEKGVGLVEAESPNLVIVDSSLTDMSSQDFISKIREFSDVALMVLSEGQSDIERAKDLEAGADEFIIKPLSPIELLAKVKALLRRVYGLGFKMERVIQINKDLTINLATQEVFLCDKRIRLTPTEYNMLATLVRNSGQVLTHSALLEKVWGEEYKEDSSFVKKYIYRLRSKIESDAENPKLILTERGIGYRFARTA